MIGEYAYAQVVKSVAVAEDGMSATIVVFNSFADKGDYVVKVKDFEDVAFVASVGVPAGMTVIAKDKNPSNVITTGVATEIVAKFYDENGVDVTENVEANTVSYKLEKTATSGEFYLANNNKLTIKKDSASATVIANYRGRFENGKMVGALEAKETFFAVNAAAVVPVSVKAYDLDGNWYNGYDAHSLQLNETKTLEIKLNHSDSQNGDKVYKNGTFFNTTNTERITVTAVTPDVADIVGEIIKPYKAGIAVFYVNFGTKQQNGSWIDLPFAAIEIEVLDNAIVSSVKLNETNILVGTAEVEGNGKVVGFSQTSFNLLGYDQRGNRINFIEDRDPVHGGPVRMVTECISYGYGNGFNATDINGYPYISTWWDAKNYWADNNNNYGLKADGREFQKYFVSKGILTEANDGESITLDYKVTYTTPENAQLTAYFTVIVQEPSSADNNYLQVKTSSNYVDIARKNSDGNRDAKTVTFDVFVMNNGVKVDTLEIAKYNANTAVDGSYQYKIKKDGQDITNDASLVVANKSADYPYNTAHDLLKNHGVKVNLSGTKAVSNSAISGVVAPDYTQGGVGAYTFELYKWTVEEGVEPYAVQQLQSDVTVVLNSAGEYSINKNAQKSNKVQITGTYAADADNILKCFTISDTNGKQVVDPNNGTIDKAKYTYFVDYTAPAGANYVYVKEITFYEYIADGVVLPFIVPVDVSLEIKR